MVDDRHASVVHVQGDRVELAEQRPAQSIAHTFRDFSLKTVPSICTFNGTPMGQVFKDEKYGYPPEWNDFLDYALELMENESAGQVKLFDLAMNVFSARPTTVIHGDLHTGNIWKNKSNGTMVLADWQVMRHAPPALDFFTLLAYGDAACVGDGHGKQLLEHYHALLTTSHPDIAADYTVEHMMDDIALYVGCLAYTTLPWLPDYCTVPCDYGCCAANVCAAVMVCLYHDAD